ncbi:unnamed protein product [Urochloa humidicola]
MFFEQKGQESSQAAQYSVSAHRKGNILLVVSGGMNDMSMWELMRTDLHGAKMARSDVPKVIQAATSMDAAVASDEQSEDMPPVLQDHPELDVG